MNPFAAYDALGMAFYLRRSLGSLAREEAHLFAYVGCLLFLYGGRSVSEWGYSFSATPSGAPYSSELEDALKHQYEVGFLVSEPGGEMLYSLSDLGETEYRELSSLSILRERDAPIEAACSSTFAVPVGVIRRAISQEPDIRAATELQGKRALLHETELEVLHDHFSGIRQAVGEGITDLLVPSVLWLSYLASDQTREESGGSTA